MISATGIESRTCPHSHKVNLILGNPELADGFLSRHFENCNTCNDKFETLKFERGAYLKQIPFVVAPKEIRVILQSESREISTKVKRRIKSLKMKRFEEMTLGLRAFAGDIKVSLLSIPFVTCTVAVLGIWSYIKFF